MQSKGLSRVFSSTTVQKHQFFGTQVSSQSDSQHPYMTTGKTIALTIWTFVGKVMSLLLNMLCRLVITFLPGNKRLKLRIRLGDLEHSEKGQARDVTGSVSTSLGHGRK